MNSPHTPVMPPAPYDTMYEQDNASWEPDPAEVERRTPMLGRMNDLRGFSDISIDDQRWARTCYHGLTTFVDEQIGRIEQEVERLGLGDDLLTIVISDHGSSIGDHGQQVKGPFDTDDIARIPLIVRGRGVRTGTYTPMVQMIDVLPTLGSLIGRGRWKEQADATLEGAHTGQADASATATGASTGHADASATGASTAGEPTGGSASVLNRLYSGRSLADVLASRAEPVHAAVFSEGEFRPIHAGQRRSVRTQRWLYTRYPEIDEDELFDLRADPNQTTNVAAANPGVVAELNERIDAWKREHGERVPISFEPHQA
jgi:arylsulfatase A-like enzyme